MFGVEYMQGEYFWCKEQVLEFVCVVVSQGLVFDNMCLLMLLFDLVWVMVVKFVEVLCWNGQFVVSVGLVGQVFDYGMFVQGLIGKGGVGDEYFVVILVGYYYK